MSCVLPGDRVPPPSGAARAKLMPQPAPKHIVGRKRTAARVEGQAQEHQPGATP